MTVARDADRTGNGEVLPRLSLRRGFFWAALVLALGACTGKVGPREETAPAPQESAPSPPRLLRVIPPAAVLSPFEPGQPPPEITLRVFSPGGRPFRLVRVRDPAGVLRGAVAPEGDGWLIRVVAQQAPETSEGVLIVETSLPEEPRFALPWIVSDPTTWPVRARQRGVPPQGNPSPAGP